MAKPDKLEITQHQSIYKQQQMNHEDDKQQIHAATSSPSDPHDLDDSEISVVENHYLSSEEHVDLTQESKEARLTKINGKVNKVSNEEIIKELKNVRKQNFVTQCLLSAMIVLTVTWQLSEFSLVLKIRNGLSNPLGIIGGFLTGGRRRAIDIQEVIKQVSKNNKHVVENSSVPGLKIPELPGFDADEKEKMKE